MKNAITIIGRGHSGTRAISHTLSASGVFMGAPLNKSGDPHPHTDDECHRRAISWKYQYELIKSTPKPKNWLSIRFEDFVLRQDETLTRLEAYLGFKIAKIPGRTDPGLSWCRCWSAS